LTLKVTFSKQVSTVPRQDGEEEKQKEAQAKEELLQQTA